MSGYPTLNHFQPSCHMFVNPNKVKQDMSKIVDMVENMASELRKSIDTMHHTARRPGLLTSVDFMLTLESAMASVNKAKNIKHIPGILKAYVDKTQKGLSADNAQVKFSMNCLVFENKINSNMDDAELDKYIDEVYDNLSNNANIVSATLNEYIDKVLEGVEKIDKLADQVCSAKHMVVYRILQQAYFMYMK